ncbi:hypothetical protein HDU98_006961 [Podochytrium sp. JEL0797]|nr:hypothetical protein HDU98_006961 [Podochytrium sp. JEL0797]
MSITFLNALLAPSWFTNVTTAKSFKNDSVKDNEGIFIAFDKSGTAVILEGGTKPCPLPNLKTPTTTRVVLNAQVCLGLVNESFDISPTSPVGNKLTIAMVKPATDMFDASKKVTKANADAEKATKALKVFQDSMKKKQEEMDREIAQAEQENDNAKAAVRAAQMAVEAAQALLSSLVVYKRANGPTRNTDIKDNEGIFIAFSKAYAVIVGGGANVLTLAKPQADTKDFPLVLVYLTTSAAMNAQVCLELVTESFDISPSTLGNKLTIAMVKPVTDLFDASKKFAKAIAEAKTATSALKKGQEYMQKKKEEMELENKKLEKESDAAKGVLQSAKAVLDAAQAALGLALNREVNVEVLEVKKNPRNKRDDPKDPENGAKKQKI